jgi:hypothetical protein
MQGTGLSKIISAVSCVSTVQARNNPVTDASRIRAGNYSCHTPPLRMSAGSRIVAKKSVCPET